jgi:hypothetical protein
MPDTSGDGLARGIAQVQCRAEYQLFWLSRGAILEIVARRPRGDVIVTTAHGLPLTADAIMRDCVVIGRESERYEIAAAWNAGGHEIHVAQDWVVLLTKARLGGRVGRLRSAYPSPSTLPELVAGEMRVRLLRPDGSPVRGDCRVLSAAEPLAEDVGLGLLTYSCRARPGLSGSPLLVGAQQQPVMIGIHLGWRMRLGGSGGVSVGRSLDGEIHEAIDAAILRAQR